MKPNLSPENSKQSGPQKFVIILLLCGCGLALLLNFLPKSDSSVESAQSPADTSRNPKISEKKNRPTFVRRADLAKEKLPRNKEQVAARLAAFATNRRELTHRYAEKLGIAVPADLEKFFDATDTGNWEEVDLLYKELQKRKTDRNDPEAQTLHQLLHPAQETWGAQGLTKFIQRISRRRREALRA